MINDEFPLILINGAGRKKSKANFMEMNKLYISNIMVAAFKTAGKFI